MRLAAGGAQQTLIRNAMSRLLSYLLRLLGLLLLAGALSLAAFRAPDRSLESLVARWAPPPSDFMTLADGQGEQLIHYRDEGPRGDALPLVLVHGTGDSLHTWEPWVKVLRLKHRVISLDIPGFGLSGPNDSGQYSSDGDAAVLLQVLDRLDVPRAVLIGHSLGGEIAWKAALRAPDRVAALTLIDSLGYELAPESVPLGFRLSAMPGTAWLSAHALPRTLVADSVRNVYADPAKVSPALIDRFFELTLREGNRTALSQRLQAMHRDSLADEIRQLRLPTLILWGAQDRLVPPKFAQRFAADIPGSRLVMLDGAGHCPQAETPERSLAALNDFLHSIKP